MSERARRTKTVFDAVTALCDAGRTTFRPGDVATHLRERETPFGAWEVRGELTNLAQLGLIALNDDDATWRLVNGAAFSIDAANEIYSRRR